MCGDKNASIPSQNKDVCKTCDTGFWLLKETQIVVKFCKGCKNFARLHDFRDKPEATKCIKCRQRGRMNYFSKKVGEGEDVSATELVAGNARSTSPFPGTGKKGAAGAKTYKQRAGANGRSRSNSLVGTGSSSMGMGYMNLVTPVVDPIRDTELSAAAGMLLGTAAIPIPHRSFSDHSCSSTLTLPSPRAALLAAAEASKFTLSSIDFGGPGEGPRRRSTSFDVLMGTAQAQMKVDEDLQRMRANSSLGSWGAACTGSRGVMNTGEAVVPDMAQWAQVERASAAETNPLMKLALIAADDKPSRRMSVDLGSLSAYARGGSLVQGVQSKDNNDEIFALGSRDSGGIASISRSAAFKSEFGKKCHVLDSTSSEGKTSVEASSDRSSSEEENVERRGSFGENEPPMRKRAITLDASSMYGSNNNNNNQSRQSQSQDGSSPTNLKLLLRRRTVQDVNSISSASAKNTLQKKQKVLS